MSEIGQAYGSASAGLGLLGIALSTLLQVRQRRVDQIATTRTIYVELMRKQIDDLPLYGPCWGGYPLKMPTAKAGKQYLYTEMILGSLFMMYSTAGVSKWNIKGALAEMFEGEVSRQYWKIARHLWSEAAEGRRRQQFFRMAEDEYHRAITAGPPAFPADFEFPGDAPEVPTSGNKTRRWLIPSSLALSLVGGIVLGHIIHRGSPW